MESTPEKYPIDPELLIKTIKKHENIWNKDTKEYHKKSMREAAWNMVCEEIVDGWDDLSDQNKNLKLLEIKKRWNNIRDYYKKDLALQISGSIGQPSMKRKKYVFSKKLEFLRPYYGKVAINEKPSDEEQEQEEEYYEVHFNSDSDHSEEGSVPLSKKQKIITGPEGTSSNAQEEKEAIEDESDLLFLKSLVPDMKALSRRQKLDFKLGILQLYKHIIDQREGAVDPFLDESEDRKFPM